MSKKRVYELAKELEVDTKDLIARMEKLGIAVRSHSSTLEDSELERIYRDIRSKEPQGREETRIKSTVIRRRAVRLATEEEGGETEQKPEHRLTAAPEGQAPAPPALPPEAPTPAASAPVPAQAQAPEPEPEPVPIMVEEIKPAQVEKEKQETSPDAEIRPDQEKEKLPVSKEPLNTAATTPPPEDSLPLVHKEKPLPKAPLKAAVEPKKEKESPPQSAPKKPMEKAGITVRKPGMPFQMEGRKLLPEERRERERPPVVIPPKVIKTEPSEPARVPTTPRPSPPPRRDEGREAPAADASGANRYRPAAPREGERRDGRPSTPAFPPRGASPARKVERPAPITPAPAAVPLPEKTWKDDPARAKGKTKKHPEPVVQETVPPKRKVLLNKSFGLKEDIVEDAEVYEGPFKRREERKIAAIRTSNKTLITVPKASKRRFKVGEAITVAELAKKMGVKASEVINKLMGMGMMVSINQAIDRDTAALVATDFTFQIEPLGDEAEELTVVRKEPLAGNLKVRAPVVTVMGHVDHGKTSLLDAIRETSVTEGEAGGITQAIGAYHVRKNSRDIVFLDTPGHEAFTAMRARGARVTDIVVLVVAADDGVKEQTVEAINHARSAGVPIMVAVNKIDKPGADPGKIKQALTEYNLLAEEWGGETIFCEVSAKKKQGIDELLELVLLQADMMDLKADPDKPARGVVIEAKLDRGRGPVSTIIIQEGTLKDGDIFLSGTEFGRVRAMYNDQGKKVKEAGPSMPVEVIGFSGIPQVGGEFMVVEDERRARTISENRLRKEREKDLTGSAKVTLEQLYEKIRDGAKDFNVIIKADVQGSVEAVSESLKKLAVSEVRLKIIHASAGTVIETDVMLAAAADAVIIGFKVRPDARVTDLAQQEGVELKLYDIIYDVIADVQAAMEGSLKPVYQEVVQGRAEIRNTFRVPKVGTVAGCYVTDGKINRSHKIRLVRDGVMVYSGKIHSLKRFKDDAREVLTGFECGLSIDGFNDLKVGDVIEDYTEEQVERGAK